MPGWDRWKQRRNGLWVLEHAILDLRLAAPPAAPVPYLDVAVAHPCSGSPLGDAATQHGYAAR